MADLHELERQIRLLRHQREALDHDCLMANQRLSECDAKLRQLAAEFHRANKERVRNLMEIAGSRLSQCPRCGGTGRVQPHGDVCPTCWGS